MGAGAPRRTPYPPEFRARCCVGADERPVAAPDGRGLGGGPRHHPALARLRRENALLKGEREILKQATVFFAHERATR